MSVINTPMYRLSKRLTNEPNRFPQQQRNFAEMNLMEFINTVHCTHSKTYTNGIHECLYSRTGGVCVCSSYKFEVKTTDAIVRVE